MITDEDPLRGLLFYLYLGFSHTLHVLKERRRRCEHSHLRVKGSPESLMILVTFESQFMRFQGLDLGIHQERSRPKFANP